MNRKDTGPPRMAAAATTREKVREILLGMGLEEPQAKDIEIGIFNASLDLCTAANIPRSWESESFLEAYLAKARSVYTNLRNQELMDRLKEGEFPPHRVAHMSRDQMNPAAWRTIIDRELLKNRAAYDATQVSMTDRFWCKKCKKNKVSYFEMQTRSADESMTIFATCLVCGYRWRM